MWGSGSLDLAKGKKFLNQLLYVQHVDKEKDTTSTISEQSLREYLLVNHKIFSDSNFSEYLRNPKANVGILKSSLKDVITHVQVYSNPLPVAMLRSEVTIHAFVAITTKNRRTKKEMWYSIEKNGKNIVLQQSPYEYDVTEKLYDAEKMELVQRPEPVTERKSARGNFRGLERLLRAIWETNQLSTNYHLLFSNCQNFASFVFRKSNSRKKWSTVTSAIVDRFGLRNKKTKSESLADSMKYNWIEKDDKFAYYKAMIERNRKDLEKLIANNLTNESINSVDSQGYTLLEWARVFSTSDWPIDQYLKDVGARNTSNEKTFRRNVFFIALQFLSSNKSRLLSFDGIYLRGVNKTGDSALHLALYGEKWDVAENILSEFKDYDVNVTNSLGCLPLHLSLGYSPFDLPVQFEFKMALMKKILSRTNSENVNKHINRYGDSALHYAITNQSKTVVEELLKHKDVDVNSKNKRNCTSLHLASKWKEIPVDLFKKILKKSTYVNAQDEDGNTALHVAVLNESKTAIKELLKRTDVDVNVRCIDNRTALHFAAKWTHMPINLFKEILKKPTDVNAQHQDGQTALHYAILENSKTAVEELLKHKELDVNLKNRDSCTALHFASMWEDIPIDLCRIILEKSTDVNAQDEDGCTALHYAIINKSKTVVEELLNRKELDVNLKDYCNRTAFCSESHLELVSPLP